RAADAVAHLDDLVVRRLHRLPAGRAGAGGGPAVWACVRPVVDTALAAVAVATVVYVMRGAFKRHRLFAEGRRHLFLRPARPAPPARPGRADREDGHRRLPPLDRPTDVDR
ncbi:hypothetical protein ACIG54_37005, partial [Streptomyces achromogenes]